MYELFLDTHNDLEYIQGICAEIINECSVHCDLLRIDIENLCDDLL